MRFMLDENVPASVATMLRSLGHEAEFVRDHLPVGSPDALVATVSEDTNSILLSFDGDFEKIAPRIPYGQRARFRRLDRVWLRCGEPQAAERLASVLSFVEAEYAFARGAGGGRMILQIGRSWLRTDR